MKTHFYKWKQNSLCKQTLVHGKKQWKYCFSQNVPLCNRSVTKKKTLNEQKQKYYVFLNKLLDLLNENNIFYSSDFTSCI